MQTGKSKFQIGQLVSIVPPSEPGDHSGYEHLVTLAGRKTVILGIVGQAIKDERFYYVKIDNTRKTIVPENWLRASSWLRIALDSLRE